MKKNQVKFQGLARTVGNGVVDVLFPNGKASHLLRVTKARDGVILFENERVTGVYNPKYGLYLNSRGKSTHHRAKGARKLDVDSDFIQAFIDAVN